jgi:hypothetical protein
MSPSLAAVSSVRERRPFTSSTAVCSSWLTQMLLQLLKCISVGCCKVPVPVLVPVPVPVPIPVPVRVHVPVPVPDSYMYPELAACRTVCNSLSFVHNVALLCTADCSTHNATSNTASCVLLFNGDVQTPNALSQHKCRLNTLDLLSNKENLSANFSLPCSIIFRLLQF